MSKKQSVRKESPQLVSVERRSNIKSPSERARIAAATVAQQQRDERTRKEALAIMAAHEPRPAPHVRDDLAAARQRALDAPMATRCNLDPNWPHSTEEERDALRRTNDKLRADLDRARAAVTAASIVMGICCIAIALWLGGELQ